MGVFAAVGIHIPGAEGGDEESQELQSFGFFFPCALKRELCLLR